MSINVVFQEFTNLSFEVVVDNVFDINSIKIISPRMQHLEAFMLDVLFSVSLNVLSQEFKITLVSLDWVAQIILIDCLLMVS